MLALPDFSAARKPGFEHLLVFNGLDIDPSPSWDASFALSSHLPAKQPNNSFLNTVIVRFDDAFIAFVSEPQQMFAPNCHSQEPIYVLINCHFNNSTMSPETISSYCLSTSSAVAE